MIIYANIPKSSGIYKILNKINNKVYIGSAKNLRRRCYEHLSQLRRGKHFSPHLQRSWNEYKEDNFSFEILEICAFENLIERENFYIKLFNSNSHKLGYNCEGIAANFVGYKHTEKSRKKIREARARQVFTEESHKKRLESILKNDPKHFSKAAKKLWEKVKNGEIKNPNSNRNLSVYKTKEFKEKISKISKENLIKKSKPFICVETGEKFILTSDAAKKYNLSSYKVVWAVLTNRKKSICGYTFKYI